MTKTQQLGEWQVIEQVPVADLKPYENNARVHDEAQVKQIADSITAFGFNAPVLIDGDGTIIAGHGRVLAAKLLGLETVPAVRLLHLTPDQRRAYILADNKIALNSSWDSDLLTLELDELQGLGIDMELLGFSDDDFTEDGDGEQETHESSRPFDTEDTGSEPPAPAERATKTTDGYVEFALVMEADEKREVMDVINAVKRDHDIDSNAAALMIVVRDYAHRSEPA